MIDREHGELSSAEFEAIREKILRGIPLHLGEARLLLGYIGWLLTPAQPTSEQAEAAANPRAFDYPHEGGM